MTLLLAFFKAASGHGYFVGRSQGSCHSEAGFFIIDDTVLDKPYSKHIDLVYRQ